MKKTFKRIFALLLSVVLTLGALPMMNLGITASAATSGSCGSEVRWQFVEYPGQLNITGSGDMDFNDELPPWDSYKNSIKTVNIGHGVTSIPEMAFMECKNLTTVNLPKTLASIGGGAFMDCDSLVSIVIPDSVTEFGSWGTFSNCDKLENVKLGNGVKYLGESAFYGCVSLKEISLPNSVEEIGIAAFNECDNLRSVKLGTGVEHISSWAFTGCSNLKEFVTNEKLEFIGEQAFSGCQIESFFVPAGVTGIYRQGLLGCKEIIVSKDNLNYADIDGVLCNKEKTALIQYPVVDERTHYSVPDSITKIGAWAFTGPVNLTEITIPESVTFIDSYAFTNADSITDIYYTGTEAEWNEVYIGETWNEPIFNATIHFNASPKTTLEDSATGIELIYDDEYETGVELKVIEVNNGNAFGNLEVNFGKENFKLYDISTLKNGVKVQPSGKVKVRIPVPAGFDTGKVRVIYYNPEASPITEIPASIVNGYVEFETDHFSYYAIVEEHGEVKSVSVDDISLNYKDSTTIVPYISADSDVDYTVTYSSSDTDVATVDANGKVNSTGKGEASITVTVTDEYGNTVTDTCKVTVNYTWWQWIIVIVLFGWIWY